MAALIRERAYSSDYSAALGFASEAHARQVRKIGGEPYIAHLLRVSALVWEMGGTEEMAIAALLHDAIEDVGVDVGTIADKFGSVVASIVWACTATEKRPPSLFESELPYQALEIEMVKLADNLDNARCCVRLLGQPEHADFVQKQAQKYRMLHLSFDTHDTLFVHVSELCKIIKQLDTNQ